MVRRAAALLLLLATVRTEAAEVIATLADGKLGVRIDTIAYPSTLPKELASGLTNRFYARVSVLDAEIALAQTVVEIAIRYDLWDERFYLVRTMNGTTVESRTLATLAEVDTLLGELPLPRLFDAPSLPNARELVLRVEVLLNPIDREKMRMIRKWVAQNSTPEVGGDQGASMSNSIFNRIFEQYAGGSDIAAVWRVSAESRPFRLDRLANERR
ncbi:MAG TPA: hypothetical protein VGO61_05815 [Steroidobacteraceae bacterium]|jgi:hypothetical protein|nr:hypothetical protein [Steroidobacteraceae bacterium]